MLVIKGVLLADTWLAWRATTSRWVGLKGRLRLCRQYVLPFSLKRRFWRTPRRLLWSELAFFNLNPNDDLHCLLALWTNYFQVQLSTTSIWARSEVCKLSRHVSTKVTWVIPLGHQSAIFRNHSTNALTGSPFRCLIVRRVGMVISNSSSKRRARKSFFRLPQFLIEPSRSFMNHSKVIPFRVPMNKHARMASFDTTFPV